MIKKSVSQVNEIIERDHTPHTNRRNGRSQKKSKSRLDTSNDEMEFENMNKT